MSWIKGRIYGRSIAAALIFFSVMLTAGIAAQASLGAHEDVEVTEDGFELNATGTAVMGYEGDGGDIVIPDGVMTIAAGTFMDEESISSVDLNEVKTIGDNAFARSGLESVEYADEVKVIGERAFAETSLTVFSVPSDLLKLSETAFDGVQTLKSFSGGSRNYPVYGGNIYADEGETLYIVPEGKSVSAAAARDTGAESVMPAADDEEDTDEDEGIDWVDADVLAAAAGRYAVVEHSLDTYDVNGGSSSSGNTDSSSSSASSSTSGTASGSSGSSGSSSGALSNSSDASDGSLNGNSTSSGAASGGTSSNTGNTAAAHSLDTTPKTADGDIDPKFVFCIALFLTGLAGLIFVRQRHIVQLAGQRSVADNGELD